MKLPWRKRAEDFFTAEEKQQIVAAIRESERRTSGELRVFVETKCRYVEPLDRAVEIFYGLKMDKTEDRNAVLVYIAMKDRQLAVFGDAGIHSKMGMNFWQSEVKKITGHFSYNNYGEGLAGIVREIGIALAHYFPYESDDKNELPDDIVFGN